MKATERVHQKASILQDEIAALRMKARETNDPIGWTEIFCRPYYEMLRSLYTEEMPLAQAIDSSDLLVHAEGPSLADDSPRLALVEQFFANLRVQVLRVTKAIAGLDESTRLRNNQIELGLSGLAPGSLYIGLRVKLPVDAKSGQQSVLGEQDPLFVAARGAVRAIKVVSQHFDERESLEERIPDPQIRDAAMVAVSRLAPSKQSGVTRVSFDGSLEGWRPRELTPNIRKELNRELRQPVHSQEVVTLVGEVRELDLDARRFELRRIESGVTDVRCAYSESVGRAARRWLGNRVEVTGRIERLAGGAPRLISVEAIRRLDPPSSSGLTLPVPSQSFEGLTFQVDPLGLPKPKE